MDFFRKALTSFLERNPDPEILVMGNGVWSLFCKPNQTLALEEYYVGLKKLLPVIKVQSCFLVWFKIADNIETRLIWF